MKLAATIAVVVVLAGCSAGGGNHAGSGKHTATRDPSQYVPVIKHAQSDFAVVANDRAHCVSIGLGTCDGLRKDLRFDGEFIAALGRAILTIEAVGAPNAAAKQVVTTTLSKLQRILTVSKIWVSCVNESGSALPCKEEKAAYEAARPDLPRVFALWKPYL